ncbi:winged helix-turn-helix transcriptional regulator [Methylobacterium sp. E-025]|uniref:winged helix-turn-helix transcriptional regulator n=1 Tax=unclassified Methylobacterium TaxID=2615210 RepID=UPI001FB9A7FA|nr:MULTISPECIES: winged helix-turn-helix transcriptional regulator [unclassified Methylobacterium]MCJ2040856.1 winged helix-turn-helix transcriptional regulator [Methylobacterium sp. J-059]MCJ2114189.1 winged helix-turn-helix transcriptional regulator [Methylobacterium sp. E-025]
MLRPEHPRLRWQQWTTLIVIALAGGAQRFGEINRTIPGISKRMLTQCLRKLE